MSSFVVINGIDKVNIFDTPMSLGGMLPEELKAKKEKEEREIKLKKDNAATKIQSKQRANVAKKGK